MIKNTDIVNIKLISKYVKWKDIQRAINYHYPDDTNNYKDLFDSLKNYESVITPANETLIISGGVAVDSKIWKEEKNDYFKDIKDEMLDTGYGIHIKKEGEDLTYSCSFIPWKIMVNMPINEDTLGHYSFEDIIAHFIWEITYYGDEDNMSEVQDEIMGRVGEINASVKLEKETIDKSE